jgi:hypothetical protein
MVPSQRCVLPYLDYDEDDVDDDKHDEDDEDDEDDENTPGQPSWAEGVLSGVRDVETHNRGRPS